MTPVTKLRICRVFQATMALGSLVMLVIWIHRGDAGWSTFWLLLWAMNTGMVLKQSQWIRELR